MSNSSSDKSFSPPRRGRRRDVKTPSQFTRITRSLSRQENSRNPLGQVDAPSPSTFVINNNIPRKRRTLRAIVEPHQNFQERAQNIQDIELDPPSDFSQFTHWRKSLIDRNLADLEHHVKFRKTIGILKMRESKKKWEELSIKRNCIEEKKIALNKKCYDMRHAQAKV